MCPVLCHILSFYSHCGGVGVCGEQEYCSPPPHNELLCLPLLLEASSSWKSVLSVPPSFLPSSPKFSPDSDAGAHFGLGWLKAKSSCDLCINMAISGLADCVCVWTKEFPTSFFQPHVDSAPSQ